MASKGRTRAFRKESVIFKVEHMEWPSTDYYFYKESIPERMRCHGCGCVSNTIYPLENKCRGHGLCRDCKEIDFPCHYHGVHVTAEALRNAVGQTNYAAKKLKIQCPICAFNGDFLNLKDHMNKKHSKKLADMLKSSQKTDYEQEEHHENSGEDPVPRLFFHLPVQRDNLWNHTLLSCTERTICCELCHSSFPCSAKETHKYQCPKMERECSDCGVNVLNENLQNHLDTECQKRVVLCGACNSMICYDERDEHDQECPEKIVVCDECEGEMPRKEKSKHASECPMRVVCCENCEGFYAYSSEKEHREQCEKKKLACEYCKLELKGDDETHKSQCPKMEKECSDCGVNVLNENLQNHLDMECQKRLVLCGACNSRMCYDERGDHDQECLEKPVVCDVCEGEMPRKEKFKHASECPMRVVCCKNCEGFYAYALKKTHKSQCPKMERECSDCGVNVLNENLQDHLDTECQKRVVICGACNSRMCYDERGDHDQECLEKPVVCDVCEGEMPRKEKSKHASECPMRVVCCKNCEGFYAYALKKHHQNECQRLPEVSKRGPIEKKSVPSVSLNVSAPPSPMGPQAASMKDHGPSSTKGSSDEEKQSCQFCGRPVKNCNYEKHLQVCWERKKECSHCSLPFFREEWKTHEDMCEKNPVNIKREPAPSVSEPWKMSQREQSRNEQAKPVKRIQELEIRQHKADRYRIDLEDGAKVHKTVP